MRKGMLLLALVCASATAHAHMVRLDGAKRVADLWLFPLADRPGDWVYLPSQARLASDARGNPEFSFIRYVKPAPPEGTSPRTITDADGGGVLHLLALYGTDPEQVTRAQTELQRLENNEQVRVTGPIVFSSGRYALISSILPTGGDAATGAVRRLLDSGSAPVLEGNRIAVSFPLDRTASSLLLESFKMAKPDVSITFDMEFSGLAEPYDATIEVDWSEVKKSEKLAAGVKIYYVGADVKLAIDELRRDGAIKVISRGSNANAEGMLTAAYAKIADLLFDPAPPDAPPPAATDGLGALLGGLVGSGSSSVLPFSISASYELKDLRSSGKTTISLNAQSSVKRRAMLTVNVGELYSRFGNDPEYFRTANLSEDPVFQQRKILVSLDGSVLPEFKSYVNSAVVTLRKTHGNGTVTLGETVITKSEAEKLFTTDSGPLALAYGWAGDDDREAWLRYEYRTRWSFQGGSTYATPWTAGDTAMVTLYPPYEHRTVEVSGTPSLLRERNVRYVIVRVAYPFFGSTKTLQKTFKVEGNAIEHSFDVTLPIDQYTTRITTTWRFANGTERVVTRDDASGIVLIDEVPES